MLAVASVLGLGACGHEPTPGSAAATVTTATTPATGTTATSTTSTTPTTAPPTSTATAAGEVPARAAGSNTPAALQPVRLEIPAIGLSTDVGNLGVAADGTVEVPSDPLQAGWFGGGPAPGQQGPAVILGHVDSHTGPAVFARLRELQPGSAVVVTRRDGSQVRFTVDGTLTFAKSAFPTDATYGPVPGPVLRLVTCGGEYVKGAGGYQSNVVVFAS